MIVKSMTRKEASFGQLLGYMNREADNDRYALRHNLYARGEGALADEFTQNAALLKRRSNGVILYHEILSISKTAKLSDHALKDSLLQIAREYVAKRAPEALVYGVVHDDHDHHLHYHLLISANAVGDAERIRLSKAEFQNVKVELEQRVLSQFPELEQNVAMDKTPGEKLSRKGGELKRRTGETPERDALKDRATSIFETAATKEELFEALKSANIELYTRGNTIGVRDLETGRKHRLKTIGLWPAFEALDERLSQISDEDETTVPESFEPTLAAKKPEPDRAELHGSPQKLEDAKALPEPIKTEQSERTRAERRPPSSKSSAERAPDQAPKKSRTSILEKGAANLWERTKAVYTQLRNSLAEPEQERTKPAQKRRQEGRTKPKLEGKTEKSSQRTAARSTERQSEPVFKAKKKQRREESEIDRIASERTRELRRKTAHLRQRSRQRDDGNEQ